jgi:hypothetical protein
VNLERDRGVPGYRPPRSFSFPGAPHGRAADRPESGSPSDTTNAQTSRTPAIVAAGFISVFTVVLSLLTASDMRAAEKRTWKEEPTSFRGIPFGTSQDDAFEGDNVCWPGDWVCDGGREKVAGVDVSEAFFFLADRFSGVVQTFDSNGYETIRDVFIRKYGRPHEVLRGAFQTRGGARSQNERLTWRGRKIVIELIRHDRNINTGTAAIVTKEFLRSEEKRIEEEKRKAAEAF